MYLVINKCVTAAKVSNFSCHYLRNRSTLDIGVLGYIGRKAQRDKGVGRILLGENAGDGTVVLRQITLQCTDVWISTALV